MAEYMNKGLFLASMGLTGDETKYGNRDAEHQHRSYSTYMSYEIMDCVDDSIVEEELAPVVHGRWIPFEHWVHKTFWKGKACSVCNANIGHKTVFKFCPNCGCRMDGGNE